MHALNINSQDALLQQQQRWPECHKRHLELVESLMTWEKKDFFERLDELLKKTKVIETKNNLSTFLNAYEALKVRKNVYCDDKCARCGPDRVVLKRELKKQYERRSADSSQ